MGDRWIVSCCDQQLMLADWNDYQESCPTCGKVYRLGITVQEASEALCPSTSSTP